jgi:hypothetical protein
VTGWDLEPPPGDAEAPPADTGAPAPVDTSPPEPTHTSGWYHLYLDGVWYDKRSETALALEHLPGGWHTLDVVLVDGGLGWELPIRDVLKVHIAEDRPDVLITAPGDNWGVHGAFDVTVATENFTLAPDHIGGEPVADEGHFEVLVDGVSKGVAGAPTTAVSGLTDGPHVVRVQLLDNAGVALSPPVYDEITVNVDSSLP